MAKQTLSSTTATKATPSKTAPVKSAPSPETTIPETTAAPEKQSLLEKLFEDMLKDMLWAERHLVGTLTSMQNVATTPELQDAFEDHIFATKKHEARLIKIFSLLGKEPEPKKCGAMEGLTKEAMAMIQETKPGTMTRDAALIIAAQKVEHYEISSYGSLVQIARTIDKENIATILEKTLWEEEDTDLLLTDIAESSINPLADEETEGDDGSESDSNATITGDSVTNV